MTPDEISAARDLVEQSTVGSRRAWLVLDAALDRLEELEAAFTEHVKFLDMISAAGVEVGSNVEDGIEALIRERDEARAEILARDAAANAPIVDGERCPRCHGKAPNPSGCAACNPRKIGERLSEALDRIGSLETALVLTQNSRETNRRARLAMEPLVAATLQFADAAGDRWMRRLAERLLLAVRVYRNISPALKVEDE